MTDIEPETDNKEPGRLFQMSQDELVNMLANLQADLEARDIVIASLQCEQRYLLLDDAKRRRYFLDAAFDIDLGSPILALQRDSEFVTTNDQNNSNENNIKHIHLDAIIDAQKRTYAAFREQLQLAEDRCATICRGFEDERRRLERDAAQGDDVVAMLEREREKLQSELEHERTQNRRIEKELNKAIANCKEQKSVIQKQRMVAAQLIKEKRRILRELSVKCEQVEMLKKTHGFRETASLDTTMACRIEAAPAISLRSPIAVETSTGDILPGNRKSLSPPPKCREFINSPPPPPSPIVPPAKMCVEGGDTDFFSSPTPSRINGFPHQSATADTVADPTKAKSPPPVKTRPEPPVRRYPPDHSISSNSSPSSSASSSIDRKLSPLAVDPTLDASGGGAAADDDDNENKRTATPSPPPPPPLPPPQMQLHYPYPGMQGNTHHPPIRSTARIFGAPVFTSTTSSATTAASIFNAVRPQQIIRSPTSPPTATHHFACSNIATQPQSQQRLSTGSSPGLLRGNGGGGSVGLRQKTSPQRVILNPQVYAHPAVKAAAGTYGGSAVPGAPRIVVPGRGGGGPVGQEASNMYINGK